MAMDTGDVIKQQLSVDEDFLGPEIPADQHFSAWLLRVKSETAIGEKLLFEPIAALGDILGQDVVGADWTATVTRVNAQCSVRRVHRFEIWLLIPARRQAHGMVYKISDG